MRIRQNQIAELLALIGLQNAELVADDSDSDYDGDGVLSQVDAARSAFIRQQIEPEMKQRIQSAVTGSAGLKLRQKLRDKIGIEMSEIKDLTDEEAIEKALAFRDSKYSQDSQTIRNQYNQTISEHAAAIEALKTTHQSDVDKLRKKVADHYFQNYLETELKDAPFPDTADRKTLIGLYRDKLNTDFQVKFDEDKNAIELLTKEGIPATNAAKTQPFSAKDAAKDFFTPLGVWQTDMRNSNASRPTNEGGQQYKPNNQAPQNSREENKNKAMAMINAMS